MTPSNRAHRLVSLLCLALAGACVQAPKGPRELNYHPRQILVRWTSGAQQDPQDRTNAMALIGAVSLREYTLVEGLELIETFPTAGSTIEDAVTTLAAQPGVVYAEHDYFVRTFDTPNDPHFRLQWNLQNTTQPVGGHPGTLDSDVRAAGAWDSATGDRNVVIAVIDTGVHSRHPDLQPNAWQNVDEAAGGGDDDANGFEDDFRGWDFFSNDPDPDDPEGHGTHVAGIIGAVGDNRIGVAGINWRCQIMPLRFMGSGRGLVSNAIAALQYAVDKAVRVSCNSWGDDDPSVALSDAILAAGDKGHLFVTAAGNRGQDIEKNPVYPASFRHDNVIAVAATDPNDQLGTKSNWGAETVHLGAPGVYVLSTTTDGEYCLQSGTSVAAAHVAGAAALVMSAHPTLSIAEVRERLFDTVRSSSALEGKMIHPGVLNLDGALGP